MILHCLRGVRRRAYLFAMIPAILLAAASVGNAAIIAEDDFSAVGSGTGWSGDWAFQLPGSEAATYSNNAMTVSGNAPAFATRELSSSVSTDFFFSYTMDTSSLTANPNDFVTFWFDSPGNVGNTSSYITSPTIGLKVDEGKASGTNDFMVRFGMDGSTQQFSSDVTLADSDVFGIIGKLSKSGLNGDAFDTLELWVYDTLAGFPPNFASLGAAQATSVGTSFLLTEVGTVGVRSSGLDAGDTVLLDNITIATVPEPMTMALWGIGGVAGLAYSARRRRNAATKTAA